MTGIAIIFVALLVLKVTGILDWSWWWITCPLWGLPALMVGTMVGGFIAVSIETWRENRQRKQNMRLREQERKARVRKERGR